EKINSGEISEERLAESVKKILMAKYFVGLNNYKPLDSKDLMLKLNHPAYQMLTGKIYENAATVIKNETEILPIQDLTQRIAYIPLEEAGYQTFYENLNFHTKVDLVQIKSTSEISKLNDYDYVIIGLHKSNETPYKSYKISDASRNIVKSISENKNTIVALFGSPYGLMNLDLSSTKAAMVLYQNLDMTQNTACNIIFGATGAKGKLPVDVNAEWKFGNSIQTKEIQRLGFAVPEAVGMKADVIEKIDQIAQKAIDEGATPGLQIVAAKNGKVIYDKSFGYQTIERKKKVENKDVYDVASVTKVTATLPLLMQEVGKGELSLDQTLGSILPKANSTDKGNLKLREILAHQSGLPPWIGFYKESVNVKNARLYLDYYSRKQDEEHPIKVTDNIYIIGSIKDTIMTDILYAPLGAKKYEYSDLGYYLFQNYLENKYHQTLDSLVQERIYKPMQMFSTTYLPRKKFDLEQIVPT